MESLGSTETTEDHKVTISHPNLNPKSQYSQSLSPPTHFKGHTGPKVFLSTERIKHEVYNYTKYFLFFLYPFPEDDADDYILNINLL